MSKHLIGLIRRAGATLDQFYATTIHSSASSKFFVDGWGDLTALSRQDFANLVRDVQASPTSGISWKFIESGVTSSNTNFEVFEGSFTSPCAHGRLAGLPERSCTGRVWLTRPQPTPQVPTGMKACLIQLPATGEHTPSRRKYLAHPLLSKGVGSLILEGPYYNRRKPEWQRGCKVTTVADLARLGAATIIETLWLSTLLRASGVEVCVEVLLTLCALEVKSCSHLMVCVAGWSMGGIHACMAASLARIPVACVAVMPPRSAAVAFCDGALSEFVDVTALLPGHDSTGQPLMSILSKEFEKHVLFPNPAEVLMSHPCHGARWQAHQPIGIVEAWDAMSGKGETSTWQAPAAEALQWLPAKAMTAEGVKHSTNQYRRALSDVRPVCAVYIRLVDETPFAGKVDSSRKPRTLAGWLQIMLPRSRPMITTLQLINRPLQQALQSRLPAVASMAPVLSQALNAAKLPNFPVPAMELHIVQQMQKWANMMLAHGSGADSCSSQLGEEVGVHRRLAGSLYRDALEAMLVAEISGAMHAHSGYNERKVKPAVKKRSSRIQASTEAARWYLLQMQSLQELLEKGRRASIRMAQYPSWLVQNTRWVRQGRGATAATARLLQQMLRARLGDASTPHNNPAHALMLALVLEAYTDLARLPRPSAPQAAVLIAARNDAYVPAQSVQKVHKLWAGSDIWYEEGGHVSGFLTFGGAFQRAVITALSRLPEQEEKTSVLKRD